MAKFSFILIAAPLAAAGVIVPTAASASSEERRSVTVHHGDLDLSSESGRDRLTTRVRLAVQKVCGSRPGYRLALRERVIAQSCAAGAMADAKVEMARLFNSDARLADRSGALVVAAP